MKKKDKIGRSQMGAIWFRFRKNKLALIGLIMMAGILFLVIFANIFIDESLVTTMDVANMLAAPSFEHWFGTDAYGRDVLARIIYGGRVSLRVGILAVFGALTIGGLLGAAAGYFGGIVENLIMRVMDVFLAIPSMMLAITGLSVWLSVTR